MPKTDKIEEDPGQDLMAANGGALFGKLLTKAVDKLDGEGAESVVAVIERLVDLKMKVDKQEAEKEFNRALSEFQNECPQIKKTSSSKKGATQGGSSFSYMYAELDEIQKTVKPLLYPRGFSFTWDTKTAFNGEKPVLGCICRLSHKNGHFRESHFEIPVSSDVGSMNEIQRHASVKTYAKRQTLVDILGLTTTENDTDGVSTEKVTKDQALDIEAKLDEIGANKDRFLLFLKVESFDDILQANYKHALQAVALKEKEMKEKGK